MQVDSTCTVLPVHVDLVPKYYSSTGYSTGTLYMYLYSIDSTVHVMYSSRRNSTVPGTTTVPVQVRLVLVLVL